MRTQIKLSEAYLSNLEGYNPAIHEEIDTLLKEAEVEELVLKRSAIPGSADFKISPDEERTIVGFSSTPDLDRDQEIVVPQGANLDQFRKSPVKIFNHNWNGSILPIGKVPAIKATVKGLLSKSVIGGNDFADQVWKTIQFGALQSNSIGFIPTEKVFQGERAFGEAVDKLDKRIEGFKKAAKGARAIILKYILLEDSIVPVPANPEAINYLMSDKSFGIKAEALEKMGFEVKMVDTADGLEELYESLCIEKKSQHTDENGTFIGDGVGKKSPENVEIDEKDLNTNIESEEEPPAAPIIRVVAVPQNPKSADLSLHKLIQDKAWEARKARGAIR
jgi:hypothetical protein